MEQDWAMPKLKKFFGTDDERSFSLTSETLCSCCRAMKVVLNKTSTFELQEPYPHLPNLSEREPSCELCSLILTALQFRKRLRPSFASRDLGPADVIVIKTKAHVRRTWSIRPKIFGTLEIGPKDVYPSDNPTSQPYLNATILFESCSSNSHLTKEDLKVFPVNQARNFLGKCNRAHDSEYYHDTQAFRPTRLVRIVDNDTVRLDGDSGTEVKYAALSYRWGPPPFPESTVKANLYDRLESFAVSMLPQTIKDAIHLTQDLGLQYVWIDALCIIQDDDQDWATEAMTMDFVYRNAWVTIAALESASVSESFLNKSASSCLELQAQGQSSTFYPKRLRFRFSISDDYEYDMPQLGRVISTSTWASRGWMMQEQLLSTRILYFAAGMVIFECSTSVFYGDDRHHIAKDQRKLDVPARWLRSYLGLGRDFNVRLAHLTGYEQWYEMLKTYTARSLTYRKDKLPAIQGLANEVAMTVYDKDIYGLWRKDLARGLLWCCSAKQGLTKPEDRQSSPSTPSWSWLSVDAPVYWGDWLFEPDPTVIQQSIQIHMIPRIGERFKVPQQLSIHGPLLEIHDTERFKKYDIELVPALFEEPLPRHMTIYFDGSDQAPTTPILLLPLLITNSRVEGPLVQCVVLEQVEGSDMYRRIGVANARKEAMHWRDEDVAEIKMI